jgi:predicted secreted protein
VLLLMIPMKAAKFDTNECTRVLGASNISAPVSSMDARTVLLADGLLVLVLFLVLFVAGVDFEQLPHLDCAVA